MAQQKLDQSPQYVVLDEKGPDHAKCFEICAEIGGRRFPSAWARSKKQAEQDAALIADIGDRKLTFEIESAELTESLADIVVVRDTRKEEADKMGSPSACSISHQGF